MHFSPASSPTVRRRPLAFGCVPAAIAALLTTGAVAAVAEPPPPGNRVSNPSFEKNASVQWTGFRSAFYRLELPPGQAPEGASVVQVVAAPTVDASGFSIDDARPSGGASAHIGAQFVASAYLRAAVPQSVGKIAKVWLRERTRQGNPVDQISAEVVLTDAFQLVTTPTYTTQRVGSQVDVYVGQIPAAPGDVFQADVVSLVRTALGRPSPKPRLSRLAIVRRRGVVSVRFRLSRTTLVTTRLEARRARGYSKARATRPKRVRAGTRRVVLGRLAPRSYRVRFVLRRASGGDVIVVKRFRVR